MIHVATCSRCSKLRCSQKRLRALRRVARANDLPTCIESQFCNMVCDFHSSGLGILGPLLSLPLSRLPHPIPTSIRGVAFTIIARKPWSLYFLHGPRYPDGHCLDIASLQSGFCTDEDNPTAGFFRDHFTKVLPLARTRRRVLSRHNRMESKSIDRACPIDTCICVS